MVGPRRHLAPTRDVGLPNPNGVVCYLNATTQALIHGTVGAFGALARFAARKCQDSPVVTKLRDALDALREAQRGEQGPDGGEASDAPFTAFAEGFARHSGFPANEQQDAADACGKLLELFAGGSAQTAAVARAAKRLFELRFQNYVLPIVEGVPSEDLERAVGAAEFDFLARARTPYGSLQAALRALYVEREKIEYAWDGGGAPSVPVMLGRRLRDMPEFLIIQVCRFAEQVWGPAPAGRRAAGGPPPPVAKGRREFKFPVGELQMGPFAGGYGGRSEYELRAVVAHIGENGAAGHYVAFAQSEAGWRRYDDRQVAEATARDIRAESYGGGAGRHRWSSACLLLYARRGATWPYLE